jgi:predicted translin family RNA/ssDNA-binding protein
LHTFIENGWPVFKSIISELEEMFSNVVKKRSKRQQAITKIGNKCHTLVESVINRHLGESKKMETEDRDQIQTVKSEFEELQSNR